MRTILATALAGTLAAQQFEPPFRATCKAGLVDTEIGHAAPYLFDIDTDGRRDLLVGQFGGGMLRIHRNLGTDQKPEFAAPEFFTAGGKVVTTPAG